VTALDDFPSRMSARSSAGGRDSRRSTLVLERGCAVTVVDPAAFPPDPHVEQVVVPRARRERP
jgi:16S rRNA A1518/A1519 N6-dimethyltransferase RsmA/KsgA/DIM1 with predicted DNA glycosylase/AP lyase activity